jgi:FkbH-like protein
VLACDLTDRYGSYGKIGVALVELHDDTWLIRLFVMSCRVVSRGVGTVFLNHIAQKCKEQGKRLVAHFKRTDRNRMMLVLYKFMNFQKISEDAAGLVTLENDLSKVQAVPEHIRLTSEL